MWSKWRPLLGKGEYPAYIACHLLKEKPNNITQDGRDGEDGNPLEGVDFA